MYQPQDMTAPTYPVPQKINGRIISFIGARGAAAVAAAAAVAVLLYTTVGGMTETVETPLDDYERSAALTELRAERAAAQYAEAEEELASYVDDKGLLRPDLTKAERERYKALAKTRSEAGLAAGQGPGGEEPAAQGGGVRADATDEELEAMVPATKEEEVQRINQVHRLLIFLIAPIGLTLAVVAEPMGMQSLASMASDRIQFNRRRRAYLYSRLASEAEEQR